MTDTSQISSTVDVLSKYNSLVEQSLGGDSVYIRAKETMQQLFDDGDITSTDKALAVSTTVTNLVNAITGASMSTALEWAKYERETEFRKLEMDAQLLILDEERQLKAAQVSQVKNQDRLALVESKRMYGTGTFVNDVLTNLNDEGKVFTDMQLVLQNTSNALVENELLDSKVNESRAAIHKVVADTYVNYGSYTFVQNANGIASVTSTHPGSHVTLSDTQQKIAVEQGKGYTYNAWANSLTGSASMLGTAIASGDFSFNEGSNELRLFDAVVSCAENLKRASSDSSTAIPVT